MEKNELLLFLHITKLSNVRPAQYLNGYIFLSESSIKYYKDKNERMNYFCLSPLQKLSNIRFGQYLSGYIFV
jgi:hypothetical protein